MSTEKKATMTFSDGTAPVELPIYEGTVGPDVIDVRKLYTNDRAQIEQEILDRVPPMMEGSGYVLHSDHSIPNTVDYQSYRFFLERGLEVGRDISIIGHDETGHVRYEGCCRLRTQR